MVAEQLIDPGARTPIVLVPQDGLLAYLSFLYRVAHEPTASHWCTPGHNRGGALAAPQAGVVLPLPLPTERRGE